MMIIITTTIMMIIITLRPTGLDHRFNINRVCPYSSGMRRAQDDALPRPLREAGAATSTALERQLLWNVNCRERQLLTDRVSRYL